MKTVIITILVLCLFIFGCSSDTVKVGWSGGLTGNLASLGKNNFRGVEIAIDEINAAGGINGKQIEFLYQDDKFEGKETLTNYQKFTRVDDVDVVLTTSYSGIFTTSPNAERDRVVVVNTVDTSEEIAEVGDYSFAVGIYDEGIGYTMAEFLAERGEERTGILYNKADPFIELVKGAFIEQFTELGGEVERLEGYDPDQGDFRVQLTKMKEGDFDFIVIIGFEEQGIVLKQAREMAIESQFVGIDTISSRTVIESAQGAADGTYFTFWDEQSEELDAFVSKYEAEYGEIPDQLLFAVTGYDSMMMVAEAMKKGDVRGEGLKNSLYSIKDFKGLAGTLSMSEDGIVRSVREKMFRVEGEDIVRIGE
ncbi:ABC transporter substrate-binding protein [Candidatus Woesearchaeota archaeon]|nr:ABC transporter substrate-binding protein [Candidatus Woesearchaeota archaeon]